MLLDTIINNLKTICISKTYFHMIDFNIIILFLTWSFSRENRIPFLVILGCCFACSIYSLKRRTRSKDDREWRAGNLCNRGSLSIHLKVLSRHKLCPTEMKMRALYNSSEEVYSKVTNIVTSVYFGFKSLVAEIIPL
jgi:hypothetical protein